MNKDLFEMFNTNSFVVGYGPRGIITLGDRIDEETRNGANLASMDEFFGKSLSKDIEIVIPNRKSVEEMVGIGLAEFFSDPEIRKEFTIIKQVWKKYATITYIEMNGRKYRWYRSKTSDYEYAERV